jgi:nucleoside-diphosphate-sugar epimerase
MKVLVAGATGVIGRPLLPLLASAGHEVIGLARTPRGNQPAFHITTSIQPPLEGIAMNGRQFDIPDHKGRAA